MRLLIVRLSSMGDVIHALPLAENARAAGATVGWLIERPFAGLLEGNPHCARVFTSDTRRWRRAALSIATLREISALRRELRGFSPDRTLDAQGLWKSAALARFAGGPVIGYAGAQRREPASALLATVTVTPDSAARHVVDRNLALLEAAGVPIASRRPDAGYLRALPSAAADAFLAALPRPFAVFHPGASRPEKAWGEERFARLAARLGERGIAAALSWGPGDETRVERLRRLLPDAAVPPLLDFAGLARVFSASALVVAGDTGPLHLADALGARTLALYGATVPERNGPYRRASGIVADMHRVSDAEALAHALAECENGRLPL